VSADRGRGPTAASVIEAFGLRAHPEGGWYAETWRAEAPADGARVAGSAILYLLAAGDRSHWHGIDAEEVWQHSAGDPLELRVGLDANRLHRGARLRVLRLRAGAGRLGAPDPSHLMVDPAPSG
jgi:predicted cupin superfamily sugar epimerase